jgi:hypothetical protein
LDAMPTTLKFHPKAFSLATLLAAHGWRKRSLSGSGAVGAFLVGSYRPVTKCNGLGTLVVDDKADDWIWFIDLVGVVRYLHLANDNPVFGVGLISFCKLL